MKKNEMYPSFENRDFFLDLGEHIAFYRKRKGITQQELADQLGITRSYMSRIESINTVQTISMELFCNISRILDVPPYYFMKPLPSPGTMKKSKKHI